MPVTGPKPRIWWDSHIKVYRVAYPWTSKRTPADPYGNKAWDEWCKAWDHAVDLADRLNKHGKYRE